MSRFEWIKDPSNYDPSYPMVAYTYLILIAICIHSILVIWPMIKIYRRFTIDTLKSIKDGIIEALNDQQKIELKNWIRVEIVYMLVPAILAVLIRLILGSPKDMEWTNLSLLVGIALAAIWISLQILQAIEMNRILNPLLSKWRSPMLISRGLGVFNLTRNQLEILSKLEANYHVRSDEEVRPLESIIKKGEDGTREIDKEATIENIKEFGKRTTNVLYNMGQKTKQIVSTISEKVSNSIDSKVQEKLDSYTKPGWLKKSQKRIVIFTLAFLPLLAIYGILPFMS